MHTISISSGCDNQRWLCDKAIHQSRGGALCVRGARLGLAPSQKIVFLEKVAVHRIPIVHKRTPAKMLYWTQWATSIGTKSRQDHARVTFWTRHVIEICRFVVTLTRSSLLDWSSKSGIHSSSSRWATNQRAFGNKQIWRQVEGDCVCWLKMLI